MLIDMHRTQKKKPIKHNHYTKVTFHRSVVDGIYKTIYVQTHEQNVTKYNQSPVSSTHARKHIFVLKSYNGIPNKNMSKSM